MTHPTSPTARLRGAVARRPAAAGAVLILVGVWLTAASTAIITGRAVPMLRAVVDGLVGALPL